MFRKKVKKTLLFIFLVLLVLVALLFSRHLVLTKTLTTATVSFGGQTVKVEIADNDFTAYRGLSYRPSLCSDCGMLFIFPDYAEREFVMRNMKFPLDIIFINHQRIIKIAANLPPEGPPPNTPYYSDGAANQVLEVNGGYCAAHHVKVGDFINE